VFSVFAETFVTLPVEATFLINVTIKNSFLFLNILSPENNNNRTR